MRLILRRKRRTTKKRKSRRRARGEVVRRQRLPSVRAGGNAERSGRYNSHVNSNSQRSEAARNSWELEIGNEELTRTRIRATTGSVDVANAGFDVRGDGDVASDPWNKLQLSIANLTSVAVLDTGCCAGGTTSLERRTRLHFAGRRVGRREAFRLIVVGRLEFRRVRNRRSALSMSNRGATSDLSSNNCS